MCGAGRPNPAIHSASNTSVPNPPSDAPSPTNNQTNPGAAHPLHGGAAHHGAHHRGHPDLRRGRARQLARAGGGGEHLRQLHLAGIFFYHDSSPPFFFLGPTAHAIFTPLTGHRTPLN